MINSYRIAALTILFVIPSCSSTTEPSGEVLPLQGVIEGHVTYDTGSNLPPGVSKPGLNLHLVSRQIYSASCYRFWTSKTLDATNLRILVRGVYRPSGPCAGEMSPACSVVNLGDPKDGVYSLQLADSETVYVGLLQLTGDQITVTFPDTTRFNFQTSIFP